MTSKRAALLCVVAILLMVMPLSSFKPDSRGHLGITTDALASISRIVKGNPRHFSDRAVKQILAANKDTDCLSCQGDASKHFDDEAFATASDRIVSLKNNVIAKITAPSPDGASARTDLGALFTRFRIFMPPARGLSSGTAVLKPVLAGRPLAVCLSVTQRVPVPQILWAAWASRS